MDERAFRACFEAHFDDVWRFARRRCGSADAADDLAAETFAVAWRRRDALPPGDEARLWLFGTARRVLANHARGERRRLRLQRRLAEVWTRPHAPDDPGDDGGGDRDLAAALAQLRPADRELLTMLAWDELTVAEIAALLGVTPNAVSVRLHKARRRLAAALQTDETRSRTGSGRPQLTQGDAT